MVGTTWKAMSPQEKVPYERVATDELERYMDAKRTFEALHRHYSTLHYGAQEAGIILCSLTPYSPAVCMSLTSSSAASHRHYSAGSKCILLYHLPSGVATAFQVTTAGADNGAQLHGIYEMLLLL